jgi:cytochrome c556
MFRKIVLIGLPLLVLLGASYLLHGQTAQPPKEKLNASKLILEALTKGDFEKLEISAERMRLIGKLEGFVRRSHQDYKTQLHSFDLANQELIRQAKRHNVEGATLAFNQLTTSCVACHVMLRDGVE